MDEPATLEIVQASNNEEIWVGRDLAHTDTRTVSVYDYGQFRLPAVIWEDLGEPSELTGDLLKSEGCLKARFSVM